MLDRNLSRARGCADDLYGEIVSMTLDEHTDLHWLLAADVQARTAFMTVYEFGNYDRTYEFVKALLKENTPLRGV